MLAMIIKEFRELRRDRRTLAMLLALPILLLVVFGYAANFHITTLTTALVGPGAAQVEQQIVKHLSGYISGVFNDYNSNLTGFTYDRNIFTAGLTGRF